MSKNANISNDVLQNNKNKKFIKYYFNYDWDKYMEINNNLNLKDDIDACNNYINYGLSQKKTIYPNKDFLLYKNLLETKENINKLKKNISLNKKTNFKNIYPLYNWKLYLYMNLDILNSNNIGNKNDLINFYFKTGINVEHKLYLLEKKIIKKD